MACRRQCPWHCTRYRAERRSARWPTTSGAAHTSLHFVVDQENAMPVADPAQLLQEFGRCDDVAAFALHHLNEDCSHFLRGDSRSEDSLLDEASAVNGVLLSVGALRAVVNVGIWHVGHARHQGREPAALLRFGGGQG